MAGTTGTRRVLLLFSVLAGLFLMHGLTGGGLGGASCHGMAPAAEVMTSATAPVPAHAHAMPAMADVPAVPAMTAGSALASMSGVSAPVAVGGPGPGAGHAEHGEICVPLRPEGLSGLFLALFLSVLSVIALWRPRLPHSATLIRPHWPHGPPRTGVQVLSALSISRT